MAKKKSKNSKSGARKRIDISAVEDFLHEQNGPAAAARENAVSRGFFVDAAPAGKPTTKAEWRQKILHQDVLFEKMDAEKKAPAVSDHMSTKRALRSINSPNLDARAANAALRKIAKKQLRKDAKGMYDLWGDESTEGERPRNCKSESFEPEPLPKSSRSNIRAVSALPALVLPKDSDSFRPPEEVVEKHNDYVKKVQSARTKQERVVEERLNGARLNNLRSAAKLVEKERIEAAIEMPTFDDPDLPANHGSGVIPSRSDLMDFGMQNYNTPVTKEQERKNKKKKKKEIKRAALKAELEKNAGTKVTVKQEKIDSDEEEEHNENVTDGKDNHPDKSNSEEEEEEEESESVNELAKMLMASKNASKKRHNLRKQKHGSPLSTVPRTTLMKKQLADVKSTMEKALRRADARAAAISKNIASRKAKKLKQAQRFGLTKFKEPMPQAIKKNQSETTFMDLGREGVSPLKERFDHVQRRNLITTERKKKKKQVRNVRYVVPEDRRVPTNLSHEELVEYIKHL